MRRKNYRSMPRKRDGEQVTVHRSSSQARHNTTETKTEHVVVNKTTDKVSHSQTHHGQTHKTSKHTPPSHPKKFSATGWKERFFYLLRTVLRILRAILRQAVSIFSKYIIPLPWRRIAPVIFSVLLIFFMFFHFYIANPNRVISAIESNVDELVKIEKTIKYTNLAFRNAPVADFNNVINELNDLSQTVDESNVGLPNRVVLSYAFRSEDQKVKDRISTLYEDANRFSADDLSESIAGLVAVSELSDELFEKDIQADTRAYIDFMEDSRETLYEIEKESGDLDLKIVIKIFSSIQLAAEGYLENNNYKQFEAQYSNVSSELLKEIANSWNDTVNGPYLQLISSQLYTQKAILDSIN